MNKEIDYFYPLFLGKIKYKDEYEKAKKIMSEYIVIQQFPSKSSKTGKVYTVKQRLDTEEYTCDCPGWVYNKMERSCIHTLTVLKNYIDKGGGGGTKINVQQTQSPIELTEDGEIKRRLIL